MLTKFAPKPSLNLRRASCGYRLTRSVMHRTEQEETLRCLSGACRQSLPITGVAARVVDLMHLRTAISIERGTNANP